MTMLQILDFPFNAFIELEFILINIHNNPWKSSNKICHKKYLRYEY